MEKQRMTPEVAYVKSINFLEQGISDVEVEREKIRFYQKVAIFSSLAIGLVTSLLTQNPTSFIGPIVIINGTVLPLSVKILGAFKHALELMKSDKEKLMTGELDPRSFYEDHSTRMIEEGKKHVLDSLSGDTSRLTDGEREMLSKFSDSDSEGSKTK